MPLLTDTNISATPLHIVDPPELDAVLSHLGADAVAWVSVSDFKAGLGDVLIVPGSGGEIAAALVGWGDEAARARDRFHLAGAVSHLPAGCYTLHVAVADFDAEREALGWCLAQYRFTRYRDAPASEADLVCPEGVDADRVHAIARAAALAQTLINTPARDMGPEALEAAFVGLTRRHGAEVSVVRGETALREANFPMIAAVGAAAAEPPRLLDMTWGRDDAPKVTLVGKGVCFDTGGLNIKPGGSMALMKKDMGGAANAMALADMVMGLGLDIRLRVLVPAVENAIAGPAMRPGDILVSRKGLTVEVNNTDAEGRLVLADALTLAEEEEPDLVISLATLTGAARVALGPDVPAFFSDDDGLAGDLSRAALEVADPLWRLPFWTPYEPMIEPGIADLDNAPTGGMAGAITAALFLRRFVAPGRSFVHVDLYGWTPQAKPGRPKGGACQAARALLALLEDRY